MLQLLCWPACRASFHAEPTSGDAQLRARRVLALVLRRRADWLISRQSGPRLSRIRKHALCSCGYDRTDAPGDQALSARSSATATTRRWAILCAFSHRSCGIPRAARLDSATAEDVLQTV